MKRASCVLVLVALVACKTTEAPPPSAEAQDASMQKPLPSGMLAPSPAPAPASAAPAVGRSLRAVREATTGEWIEIQPAPEGDSPKKTKFDFWRKDSLFVPLDAMSLLHDAFARAQTGFSLFTPQLFTAMQLGELKAQLRELKRLWTSVPTAQQARQRWPYSPRVKAALTDELWRDFQGELVFTIDEITKLADEQIKKGEGAWVLSPR